LGLVLRESLWRSDDRQAQWDRQQADLQNFRNLITFTDFHLGFPVMIWISIITIVAIFKRSYVIFTSQNIVY